MSFQLIPQSPLWFKINLITEIFFLSGYHLCVGPVCGWASGWFWDGDWMTGNKIYKDKSSADTPQLSRLAISDASSHSETHTSSDTGFRGFFLNRILL